MLHEYEYEGLPELESDSSLELDRVLENLAESEAELPPQKATPSGGMTIVSIPANAKVFVLRGFSPKSAKPTSTHVQTARALANEIVKRFGGGNQVGRIQLTGHTADSAKTLDDDLDIGLRRARSVRKVLQAFFPISSMFKSSFKEPSYQECSAGSSQPDSTVPADNRRVVITLL